VIIMSYQLLFYIFYILLKLMCGKQMDYRNNTSKIKLITILEYSWLTINHGKAVGFINRADYIIM